MSKWNQELTVMQLMACEKYLEVHITALLHTRFLDDSSSFSDFIFQFKEPKKKSLIGIFILR